MIRRAASCRSAFRRGFTLVELLITVSIIAIMSSMVLFAMFQAQDAARAQKTRTLIAKLNNIIMTRYDEYRTRRIPYHFPPITQNAPATERLAAQKELARARLDCLHDLMRLEMPDRWSDVVDPPAAPFAHGIPATTMAAYGGTLTRPPLSQVYLAKYNAAAAPTDEHQGAECLYMIVMAAVAQQGDSRDVFKATDIGDVDEDGMPEFLDGWGYPIRFLRWAPGYPSEMQMFGDIRPANVAPGGTNEVLVQFPANRFRPTGDFVGGTMAVKEVGQQNFNPDRMAKITGYRNDGTNATFTCKGTTTYPPFGGTNPLMSETILIMHADSFDPRGIYPDYVTILQPTFLTYPFVYSAGPDRSYGIRTEFDTTDLQYKDHRLNPCVVEAGTMIGMQGDFPDEPRYKPTGWLDNITNHQPNAR